MHPHVRFHFRANDTVINLCLTALETYKHVAKRHKYVHGAIKANLKEAAKCWTRRFEPNPVSIAISYPESCMLADAVHFLLECDAQDPHLGILRDEHRKEAQHLVGALGDFNSTQFRHFEEARQARELANEKERPNEATLDQQRWAAKRDAIFHDIVGRPDRVNIWGQVVEDEYVIDIETTGLDVNEDHKIKAVVLKSREPKDGDKQYVYDLSKMKDEMVTEMVFDQKYANFVGEPVIDHKAKRQEGMVKNFAEAYGGDPKDLRKQAKTTNFACHPLQWSRVPLSDPDAKEAVAAINENLNKMRDLQAEDRIVRGGKALQYKPTMTIKLKRR